jgi:integrase
VWELRVYIGVEGGRKRWVSRTHRGDARSADVALARLVVAAADGEFARPSVEVGDDPLVREWLEAWFARESPGWSPSSVATARNHLDRHIVPALGDRRLGELRRRDVEEWIGSLGEKGLAPATVHRVFGVLRSALEQAERWEVIARNPAAKARLPRVRYCERPVPTAADLVAALELARNPSERTLVWLAAATGARRGQLVALRWSDFDLREQVVTFHRAAVKVPGGFELKEPKGGRPIRAAVDDTTCEVVAGFRRHRQSQALAAGVGRLPARGFLFSTDPAGGRCWHPDQATKVWERIRGARHPSDGGGPDPLVLPQLEGVRLHDLRHAHATLLIAAGVDRRTVAGRLGHAQVSTTDRYSHPVTDADRAAARIIGELLAGT